MTTLFPFKRGDVVKASGEIAVIIDAHESPETGDVIAKIRFIRNLGDSRPYDLVEITPQRAEFLNIAEWEIANPDELQAAIEKRQTFIQKEAERLVSLGELRGEV